MKVKWSFLFLIIIGIICGCGKEPTEINECVDLLSDTGQKIDQSIDDIYLNNMPLVKKATTYSSSGDVTQVVEYEYDENSRLLKELISHANLLTGKMVPFLESTYSYDEFFRYKNTKHLTKQNLTTLEVVDCEGNVIVSEKVDISNEIRSENYTYRCVNNQIRCFKNEFSEFEYCQSNYYDNRNNLVLSIKQYSDDHIEKQSFEYEYDKKNRLIKMRSLIEDSANYGLERCGCEICEIYEYDQEDRLSKKEVITKFLSDRTSKEITEYTYKDGCLTNESTRRIIASNDAIMSDTKLLIQYEY